VFSEVKNTTFRKLGLFPSSGEEGDAYSVGYLSKGRLSSPSPKEGNKSNFRNAMFYNFLEFWAMDKVTNPVILNPVICFLAFERKNSFRSYKLCKVYLNGLEEQNYGVK
jgi:hypothetical protein